MDRSREQGQPLRKSYTKSEHQRLYEESQERIKAGKEKMQERIKAGKEKMPGPSENKNFAEQAEKLLQDSRQQRSGDNNLQMPSDTSAQNPGETIEELENKMNGRQSELEKKISECASKIKEARNSLTSGGSTGQRTSEINDLTKIAFKNTDALIEKSRDVSKEYREIDKMIQIKNEFYTPDLEKIDYLFKKGKIDNSELNIMKNEINNIMEENGKKTFTSHIERQEAQIGELTKAIESLSSLQKKLDGTTQASGKQMETDNMPSTPEEIAQNFTSDETVSGTHIETDNKPSTPEELADYAQQKNKKQNDASYTQNLQFISEKRAIVEYNEKQMKNHIKTLVSKIQESISNPSLGERGIMQENLQSIQNSKKYIESVKVNIKVVQSYYDYELTSIEDEIHAYSTKNTADFKKFLGLLQKRSDLKEEFHNVLIDSYEQYHNEQQEIIPILTAIQNEIPDSALRLEHDVEMAMDSSSEALDDDQELKDQIVQQERALLGQVKTALRFKDIVKDTNYKIQPMEVDETYLVETEEKSDNRFEQCIENAQKILSQDAMEYCKNQEEFVKLAFEGDADALDEKYNEQINELEKNRDTLGEDKYEEEYEKIDKEHDKNQERIYGESDQNKYKIYQDCFNDILKAGDELLDAHLDELSKFLQESLE